MPDSARQEGVAPGRARARANFRRPGVPPAKLDWTRRAEPSALSRRSAAACPEFEEAMRLGMFMMPVHPAARSLSDTLAEDTAKSLLADALGFDKLWLGEHFSASTEPIPSP